MTAAPPRRRCEEHGLLYDPLRASGCTLCRRGLTEPSATHAGHSLSWRRVLAAVGVALIAFSLVWKLSRLSDWAEARSRAALGRTEVRAEAAPSALDPVLLEETLQQWERFQFDPSEAPRVVALGIATYVPRDNLASIEDRVTGRRPNRSEVLDGLRQLDRALLRYPERFLRASGLERLVWLCEIVKDGAKVRGFALPPARALVLDPRALSAPIFDHELFHLADYRLHGHSVQQPAWEALNPPGSGYIGVLEYAKELSMGGGLGHTHPHFITAYARAAAEEDRAETFRVLIGERELAKQRRAASPVIDAKARYIIAALDQLADGSSVALDLR